MKSPLSILQFIWNHPLASRNRSQAFKNFIGWQIGQKIFRRPVVCPLVEDSVLLVEKGMAGATGNIYTGLLEFDDMAFVLHMLRPGDLFADIGANVGAYTVLAAKNAGANVVAVEPVPSSFKHLSNNIYLNSISNLVLPVQAGVGGEEGTLAFTNNMDTVNHVVPNYDGSKKDGIIEVQVKIIDNIFESKQPCVMKMDIEGFEWPALNGAKNMLANTGLKAIVIELNGCGNSYGFSDDDIHAMLTGFGFAPYSYEPFKRAFAKLSQYGRHNTIYIRDIEWAKERAATAKRYQILSQSV
jgi:FkbM family methyltransferase